MLISILIPCFNAERWIAAAIESALAQTWPDKEVIVVDDGSTDRSNEIIATFSQRIRHESAVHAGGNHARNRLLELSAGQWLQYLDADDYLLPGKLSSQVEFLANDDRTDVLYGPVTLEFADAAGARRELLPIPEPHDPWILLARWFLPQTGAPLWRKRAIEEVGGWNVAQRRCQEHELYLRLLMAGKHFAYAPSNGAVYRQWSESTLWKSDRTATRAARMAIVQRLEDHLRSTDALTPARLWAINQSRFEMARSAWPVDHAEAQAIVKVIERSQPDFLPAGDAAPRAYRWLYRSVGFAATETLAGWRRRIEQ